MMLLCQLLTLIMKLVAPRMTEKLRGITQEKLEALSCPAGIYLLKVKNRNTRTMCEICLKMTIKKTGRRH